jgi:hypothetical protein
MASKIKISVTGGGLAYFVALKIIGKPWFTIFCLLVVSLFICGCEATINKAIGVVEPQIISNSISVGSEWVEITPPQPLKTLEKYQHYFEINMIGVANYSLQSNEKNIVILADGTKITVEAIIIDDQGKSFELAVFSPGSNKQISGFVLRKSPDNGEYGFPADKIYTKLRLKTDTSVTFKKIEWISSTNNK